MTISSLPFFFPVERHNIGKGKNMHAIYTLFRGIKNKMKMEFN